MRAATPDQVTLVVKDDEGRPLDATVTLETESSGVRATFEARWGSRAAGTQTNTQYRPALDALVARALSAGWALDDALLASRPVIEDPPAERRLQLSRRYPVGSDWDAGEIVRELSAAMAQARRRSGAQGHGNPTKRLQLFFSHPDGSSLGALISVVREGPREAAARPDSNLGTPHRGGGQGRSSDSEFNAAVEQCAMRAAAERFEADGWSLEDTSANRPYDYVAEKNGHTVRVEVKGTTQGPGTVEVTSGEVDSARAVETCLFVLHDIEARKVDGTWVASKGRPYEEWPWTPEGGRLFPVRFRYRTRGTTTGAEGRGRT